MVKTLEESVRSVVNVVDERFEIIIIDAGSTDGSLDILDKLDKEFENIRIIKLPASKSRNLGKDRDISIRMSKGKYIISHVDCDDTYDERIVGLAEAYNQIDEQVNFRFGMSGGHVTIARRDFLIDIGGYRNIQASEDIDLWLRMMAGGGYILLDCESIHEEIGDTKTLGEKFRRVLNMRISEFQIGMSYRSYVNFAISRMRLTKAITAIFITTLGYLLATRKCRFERPSDGFHQYEKYQIERKKMKMTPEELEEKYNIDVDWNGITSS